mmetsp:Transcript_94943/g.307056  ORF Transcript_94943/g.307056 Transcript_94943/m.307056 type:complete len:222 (+) Transcript_94943:1871-2536(+)
MCQAASMPLAKVFAEFLASAKPACRATCPCFCLRAQACHAHAKSWRFEPCVARATKTWWSCVSREVNISLDLLSACSLRWVTQTWCQSEQMVPMSAPLCLPHMARAARRPSSRSLRQCSQAFRHLITDARPAPRSRCHCARRLPRRCMCTSNSARAPSFTRSCLCARTTCRHSPKMNSFKAREQWPTKRKAACRAMCDLLPWCSHAANVVASTARAGPRRR